MQPSRNTLVLQGLWGIWLALLFIPFFFQVSEIDLAPLRQHLLSICHQKTERFFAVSGFLPLVCSRCVGIYAGILFFGFWNFKQPIWLIVLLVFLPIAADKIVEHATILPIDNTTRFASGIVMGLGFSGLIWRLRGKRR